jgi:hypothetical protein
MMLVLGLVALAKPRRGKTALLSVKASPCHYTQSKPRTIDCAEGAVIRDDKSIVQRTGYWEGALFDIFAPSPNRMFKRRLLSLVERRNGVSIRF